MYRRFFNCLAICSLLLTVSCSTKILNLTGDVSPIKTWKKVALLELVITPPDLPIFPLLDAGIYRGVFLKNASTIQEINKAKINELTESLGKTLSEIGKIEVLYGNGLAQAQGYSDLKLNGVETFDKKNLNNDFQEVVLHSAVENFFDFSTSKSAFSYFENNQNFGKTIEKICKALNIDGVIVGVVSVPTLGVSSFGITGSRLLQSQLYFVNAQGATDLKVVYHSEMSSSKPGDTDNYSFVLGQFPVAVSEIVGKVYAQTEAK